QAVRGVGEVCRDEGIDAEYVLGGSLAVATTEAQAARVREGVKDARSFGFGEDDYALLEGDDLRTRIEVAGGICAIHTPHCAAVNPAKLTRGLASVVESLGVKILEQTAATRIDEGAVRTTRGSVRAEVIIRATEGYTGNIEGHQRLLAPVEIFMIATEPLPESFWNEVGWRERECVNDAKTMFVYSQRTADDRIAIGAGGARYHLGAKIPDQGTSPKHWDEIQRQLIALFPGTSDAEITHKWGGVMGVPRDWSPSIGYRRETGIAWAGGYVGDGVSTANLAGRTLRDLINGETTDITALPWVNHRWRRWEPEPLPWVGINTATRLFGQMDRNETRSGKPSRLSKVAEMLIGESSPSSSTS
ncbi:MAG: FAD-binding oxidoreductase, partial [Actinobacteria bacterium]|nr:FAD-binding oxidoreductase [Actinomycetota bacterium]